MRGVRGRVGVVVILVALAGCSGGAIRSSPTTTEPSTALSSSPATRPSSSAGDAVRPLPPGRASYQLSGAYPPAHSVRVVVRDRADQPDPTRYSVCYINAFQAQPEELPVWRAKRPNLLLRNASGQEVVDTFWNERVLDIGTADKRQQLIDVVGPWIDGCRRSGFDAVEFDNLDSYTRSGGQLDLSDAEAFARLLVQRAHRVHLAVAQKNTVDLLVNARSIGFDFAIVEECEVYAECERYVKVYGSAIIEIEYTDFPVRFFQQACRARADRVSVVLRDRQLIPAGRPGHVERWC